MHSQRQGKKKVIRTRTAGGKRSLGKKRNQVLLGREIQGWGEERGEGLWGTGGTKKWGAAGELKKKTGGKQKGKNMVRREKKKNQIPVSAMIRWKSGKREEKTTERK